MKAMKKVFAMLLALAMIVTAVPVADASAATYNMKAGSISKSLYAGRTHTLKLNGLSASKVKSTKWTVGKPSVVKLSNEDKTKATMKLVGKGYTVVTAKVTLKTKKTKTYKAKITVKNPKLTIDQTELTIPLGRSAMINVTSFEPSGEGKAKLTYVSLNEAVATVSGGKVTATGLGETEIVTSVVCGTKKVSKKTKVKVEPAADGVTILPLGNPISADYPNTVWVNDQACIRVMCIQGGKPLAGENVVITKLSTTSYSKSGRGTFLNFTVGGDTQSATVTTDADGIATFVVGYNLDTIKATDTGLVGHFDYKVSLASDIKVCDEGSVDFAAIDLGSVKKDGNLTVSTNDYKVNASWYDKGDGYTATSAASTRRVRGGAIVLGKTVEYVDSQQVSAKGSDAHKVTFKDFVPKIMIPKRDQTDISAAKEFVQEVNLSSGAYDVYTDSTKEQTITLDAGPNELTYATLNFSKIQLSEHTKLVIGTYNNAGAKLHEETIQGPVDMNANGYQIPLDERYGALKIKLQIVSKGQVNTDRNAGYEVKDITGVYRTVSADGGYELKELPGAKVDWTTSTAKYSNVKVLTQTENDLIKAISGVDLYGTYSRWDNAGGKGFAKVTYQVPVFPYTGNAILTCFDANGKAKSYYVCPTVNKAKLIDVVQSKSLEYSTDPTKSTALKLSGIEGAADDNNDNENVLDIYTIAKTKWWEGNLYNPAKYCYEVSASEVDMTKTVGSIVSQDDPGKLVVNSNDVGITNLEGTVTLGSEELDNKLLDATNNKLYTSVQWCPLANNTSSGDEEFAIKGQKVNITAKVYDVNGNPVNVTGLDIAFYYGEAVELLDAEGGRFYQGRTYGNWPSQNSITALRVDNKTDMNGEAKMVLQAGREVGINGLYAVESSGRYNVKLRYDNGDELNVTRSLNWLDADLRFTASALENPTYEQHAYAQTSTKRIFDDFDSDGKTRKYKDDRVTKPITTTDTEGVTDSDPKVGKVNPRVGTNWNFGFETYRNYGSRDIKMTDLGIIMTHDPSTVGSASVTANGVMSASSKVAGKMDIIGRLDNTSDASKVRFTDPWGLNKMGVGEGSVILSKKLTLNVYWQNDGYSAEFKNPNGTRIYDVAGEDEYTDVYLLVADKVGNPYKGVSVTFTKVDTDATTIFANGKDTITVTTDSKGIARTRLWHQGTNYGVDGVTIVNAKVNNTNYSGMIFSQTYTWVRYAEKNTFGLETNVLREDGTYQSFYDSESGELWLVFNKAVVDSSVVKDMISGRYVPATGTVVDLVIGGVRVVDNAVVVTINNKISNISGGTSSFEITFKRNYKDGQYELNHSLTSVDGMTYAGDVTFVVYVDSKEKPSVKPIVRSLETSLEGDIAVKEIETSAVLPGSITVPSRLSGISGVSVDYFSSNLAVAIAPNGRAGTGMLKASTDCTITWGGAAGVAVIVAQCWSGRQVARRSFVVIADNNGFVDFYENPITESVYHLDEKDVTNAGEIVASVVSGAGISFKNIPTSGVGSVNVVSGSAISGCSWAVTSGSDILAYADGKISTKKDKDGKDQSGTATLVATVKSGSVSIDVTYSVEVEEGKITKVGKLERDDISIGIAVVGKPY